jgi:dihydroorotase
LVFRPIEEIAKVIEDAERYGLVISLHAEDGDMISDRGSGEVLNDRGSLSRHLSSRPAKAEVSAIDRALKVAGHRSPYVHLLHISSKDGIERARDSGASVEVTPHHLLLDMKWCESNLEMEAMAKVNPPVRTTSDRAALWEALLSGHVTTIGSDHAPHLLTEKGKGGQAPSGMPGTETMLPLLVREFMERKLDLRILQRALCEGPAERFGLEGKGSMGPGQYADIVVLDPREVRKVRPEDLHSKCGWTPYEGFSALFPTRVYSRGELIVENGNICCRPGRGAALSLQR